MNRLGRTLVLPILLVAGGSARPVNAQALITVHPLYDTYVNSHYPNANYGSEDSLFVHVGTNTKRTFLQFDLTGVPPDSVVGASLNLAYAQGSPTGTLIDLYLVADDAWLESSVNWNSMPGTTGGAIATAVTELGKTEIAWDLPSDLVSSHPDGRLSFLLKLQDEGLSDTATFFSKESTLPVARASELRLTVPEPAPLVSLTALGLLVWVAYRRAK